MNLSDEETDSTEPSLDELGQPFEWVIQRALMAAQARAASRPSDHYIPGRPDWPPEDRFQLQFHKSPHIVRAMFPGNGAGKTTVAGIEAEYWLQHRHPFQHVQHVPDWPIQAVWVCLKFGQMELLREQLEAQCFTPGWTWNDQKHRYRWPNKSTLTVLSNDGEWGSIQGINPDLVIIDEECDERLWRELTMRRRGRRKTRYCISATATKGKRWMYHTIFKPWLDYHSEKFNLDEDGAMLAQRHPRIWCWSKGGLEDNPVHTPDDVQWYDAALAYAAPAERAVRLHGGFRDMNASPVFHQENIELLWRKMEEGKIVPEIGKLVVPPKPLRGRGPVQFVFQQGELYAGGEIRIYDHPQKNEQYVIGADFGYGLENRDWDTACVIGVRSRRQVAAARGRWGDVHFAWVLFAMGWYYNQALLVGERQVGLPTMRRLHDEWGYVHQYCELEVEHKAARKSDLLGHHRQHGDLVIPRLQWAIAPLERGKDNRVTGNVAGPVIQFVDRQTLEELRAYEWKPRKDQLELSQTTQRDLSSGAPAGGFDDLVMASAYAVMGWIEFPKFEALKPKIVPGSLGDILKHGNVFDPEDKTARPFRHARSDNRT